METGVILKLGEGVLKLVMFLSTLNKRKVYGLCMSASSGKTTLVKNLRADGVRPIDLEEYTLRLFLSEEERKIVDRLKNEDINQYECFFEPKCKKYVEELKKNYPNEKLVVVASSVRLLQACGCTNIRYYAPAQSLFNTIRETVEDNDITNNIISGRMRLVSDAGKKLMLFSSFEGLSTDVKKWLKLKLTL